MVPRTVAGHWHYVVGVDLGYDDPTAFALCACHDYDKTLFVLEAEKHARLDVTSVADRIRGFQARYDLDSIIIDGANKQAVEEMRRRHGLPLNVLASVSQWEREAIGERTATAMQHKARQGEYTGGWAPYGRRVAQDGARLERDPTEEAARAVARQLRAQGLSLRRGRVGAARSAESDGQGVRAGAGGKDGGVAAAIAA